MKMYRITQLVQRNVQVRKFFEFLIGRIFVDSLKKIIENFKIIENSAIS